VTVPDVPEADAPEQRAEPGASAPIEGNLAPVSDLTRLFVAIAARDQRTAVAVLDATPSLATAGLARRDEFFSDRRMAQVYEGDTALHAAAFSYDAAMARELVTRGADIRAKTGGVPNRSTQRRWVCPDRPTGTRHNNGRSFSTSSKRVLTPTRLLRAE
jgi:Ankyrin repeat